MTPTPLQWVRNVRAWLRRVSYSSGSQRADLPDQQAARPNSETQAHRRMRGRQPRNLQRLAGTAQSSLTGTHR